MWGCLRNSKDFSLHSISLSKTLISLKSNYSLLIDLFEQVVDLEQVVFLLKNTFIIGSHLHLVELNFINLSFDLSDKLLNIVLEFFRHIILLRLDEDFLLFSLPALGKLLAVEN